MPTDEGNRTMNTFILSDRPLVPLCGLFRTFRFSPRTLTSMAFLSASVLPSSADDATAKTASATSKSASSTASSSSAAAAAAYM